MNKKIIIALGTIGLFLLIIIAVILFGVIKTNEELLDGNIGAKKSTIPMVEYRWDIIVPDDYSTIQEAIDYANKGDCIFVRNGVYKENIVVDKEELFMQGEDKFTTIIDGGKITDAVILSASDVTIQGFTISNGWNKNEYLWDVAGVKIYSSNVIIKGNRITSNRLGITVMTPAYNLTISDNSFIGDSIDLGNYLYSSTLTKDDFLHEITNNTVNGKPLYYYKNKQDFSVPTDAGGIILANCTNAIIKDMYLSNADFSIVLGYCSHCIIENSTIMDTDGELILMHSENNTIQNNYASNSLHGICLDFESKNNIVRYNEVSDNWVGISALTSSSNNRVYGNIVHDNGAGIMISTYVSKLQSQGNTISENEIYNNNVGIQIGKASFDNIIQDNDISKNKIGVQLKNSSDGNTIRYNNFKKNFPITAVFNGCSTNTWDHNYWNRPRILPKPIIGYKTIGKVPIPWINIDRHPAKQPYDL